MENYTLLIRAGADETIKNKDGLRPKDYNKSDVTDFLGVKETLSLEDTNARLNKMVIPRITYEDASIQKIIVDLKNYGEKVGVNILHYSASAWESIVPPITLDFDDIKLGECIRYLCVGLDLQFSVHRGFVVITHKNTNLAPFESRFIPFDVWDGDKAASELRVLYVDDAKTAVTRFNGEKTIIS